MRSKKRKKSLLFSFRLSNMSLFKILLILFLLGMVYGALMVGFGQAQTSDQLSILTDQFINKRAEQSIVFTFFNSFSSSMLLLFAAFLLGFCAVGQPGSFFIPLFRGLGLGLSTAYLYAQRGWQGALFTLILILPTAAISTFALLLASKESIRFSNRMFKMLLPDRFESDIDGDTLRLYLLRFFVLMGLIALSALVDTLCTFLFAGFF